MRGASSSRCLRVVVRRITPGINTAGCAETGGLTLLCTGISPFAPPANGKAPSKQNIRSRLRTHYTGNAEGSTLRKTLGCLMSDQLGLNYAEWGQEIGGRS